MGLIIYGVSGGGGSYWLS